MLIVKCQIICCKGWNILLVWGGSGQFGQSETTVWISQISQWSDFGDWGLQSFAWSSTLPCKSCCLPPQWEFCFYSFWQVHFYSLCGFCKLSTNLINMSWSSVFSAQHLASFVFYRIKLVKFLSIGELQLMGT